MMTNSGHNPIPQLYIFLASAMEIVNADKGNIQFYYERDNTLLIAAQIGFNDDFLSVFKTVAPGRHACGEAMRSRARVIIEDTSKDPSFDVFGSTSSRFGFAAVQSTPLFDLDEKFFGVLSTHFKRPHRPAQTELAALDEYLLRAMPSIDRRRAEFERT